jgi:hypothetical protein
MEIVEIKMLKKPMMIIIAVMILAMIATVYFIFFSGKIEDGSYLKYIYIPLTATFVYQMYHAIKKLQSNEPILRFTKDFIEINDKNKPVTYSWFQIKNWKIETDDSTPYLILETNEGTKKVGLVLLEKNPTQIEALMKEYKK